jgi:hypothetical protein
MATSNPADFKVKNGLVVNTTATFLSTVNSTSTTTGGAIHVGGVAIAKDLWVGGITNIRSTTSATNTTTGALQVVGGVGIQGDLYARNLYSNGILIGTNAGNATTATNLALGTAGQVPYQTGPGQTSFFGPGTAGNVLVSNGTSAPAYQNTLTLAGITTSSSTNTGALQVVGGAGIGGNLNVGGTVTVGSGAATVASSNGDLTLTAVGGNVTTTNVVIISNTSSVSSTTTGALRISGGVGVVGGGFFGGIVTATTFVGNLTGTATNATTATNLASGTQYQIPYQQSTGTTVFILPPPTSQNSLLQFTTGTGFTWTNTTTVGGGTFFYNPIVDTFTSAGTTTTYVLSTAPTSKNILTVVVDGVTQLQSAFSLSGTSLIFSEIPYNGATIDVHYANVLSTTTIVAAGLPGQILYNWNGITSGTTLMSYNSSTGVVNITGTTAATSTSAGALVVTGGVGVGGDIWAGNMFTGPNQYIYFGGQTGTRIYRDGGLNGMSLQTNNISRMFIADNSGSVTVTTTTNATSTSTGALKVEGGVGIGGNLYVGGEIVASKLTIQLTTVTTTLVTTDDIISTYNTTPTNSTNTGALQIGGGIGVGGGGFFGGIVTATLHVGNLTGTATTATNLAGGVAGQFAYQTAPGATSFVSTGSMYVSRAVFADSASGSAGSVANALTIGTGLSGTAGTYNGSAAVTISLNTATLMATAVLAQTATTATNAGTAYATIGTHSTGTGILGSSFNGSANQTWTLDTSTLMARAVQTVQSLSTGTGIFGGTFNGSTAQTWSLNTATLMATAVTATNLAGGTAGQFAYQTAPGVTSFASTGSMYVNRAVIADSASGGSAQVNTVAQPASGNYYPTFVDSNNAAAAAETVYTTSSFFIDPSTGAINATRHVAIDSTLLPSSSAGMAVQNGSTSMNFIAYAGGGNYNPATQSGDSLLYWRGVGQGNSGALNIAPWSSTATGIRITSAGVTTIASTVSTFSTTTGALVVGGGAGIAGGLVVGGTVTATNMILNGYQVSTSSALTIQGYGTSLGTASTLNFSTGTTATVVGGVATIQALGSVSSIIGGTDTVATSLGGAVTIWNTSTLQSITNRGATTTNIINITNATAGSSTITGALVVAGGIGIGGNFYTSGVQRITNSTAASSTTTGALVVTGGVGIGGSLYAGNIYTNGSQVLPTNIQEITATGGQTTFTITGGYTVGSLQVFANGVNLGGGDYTASNGTTVVVNIARTVGDVMRFVSAQTSSSINNINALAIAYSVAFGG